MKIHLVLFLFMLIPVSLSAEYIFLKDGTLVKGTIVSEGARETVVRTESGDSQTIPAGDILRTLYTEIYLGKQLVRLTDGTSFEAHMVYADRRSYIFRRELNATDEMRIARKDVLYLSRNNPTNLTGRPGETSLSLRWNAPYRPPQKYTIYLQGPGENEFTRVAESFETVYMLRNLEKKRQYRILVKGVDEKGEESLPSNVLVITTNIPPDTPKGVIRQELLRGTPRRREIILSWDKAADPDGTVVRYVVYEIAGSELLKKGETEGREFTLQNLDPDKEYRFHVSAVDNNGAESMPPDFSPSRPLGVTLWGGYVRPLSGGMEEIGAGYEAALFLDYRFLRRGGFHLAALGGPSILYHGGGSLSDDVDLLVLAGWGGFAAGYSFTPALAVELALLGGYARSQLSNHTSGKETLSHDPAARALLSLQYQTTRGLVVALQGGYSGIFYLNTIFHELHLGAGAGVRL